MIYSVISSTKATIKPIDKNRDILGISWKFREYKTIKDDILTEILENDVTIHKGDIITVTTQAVLMVFPDLEDELYHNYVEERINAIEIFWRQKFLLKKMHFKLNYLITNIEQTKEKSLEKAVDEIQKMQITIQSELEVYRNTIISITHSYSMLLETLKETLNKVFKIKNHYNSVQEKLEASKSIYESLNEEKRNILMENIQWIVVLVGMTTIILQLLIVYYEPIADPKESNLIIFFIGLILIVGIYFILFKWLFHQIKKLVNWLKYQIKQLTNKTNNNSNNNKSC